MHSKKELGKPLNLLLACLWLGIFPAVSQAQIAVRLPKGVTLEVLSVRVLSDQEARQRAPDFIGTDMAVRLRLSNSGSKGVYFCAWSNKISPVVSEVKQTEKGIAWLWGRAGEEKKSPGLAERTLGLPISWVLLSGYSAVEWEELDSTLHAEERHAFSFFLKENETSQPNEVLSDFFTVPIRH